MKTIIWSGMITFVVLVTAVLYFLYENRKYPECPVCMCNEGCQRAHFFDREATCRIHGRFVPKRGKRPGRLSPIPIDRDRTIS